jgi:three-Cys-motif partner protein
MLMAGKVQEFGSKHTERKLKTVHSYLGAFTTALKKQAFELLYVDACAGSGASKAKGDKKQGQLLDVDEITVGSAIRALQVDTPFDKYLFNDKKQSNINSLKSIVDSQFRDLRERVSYSKLDANAALLELCRITDWKKSRAVVFVDPFGLQIEFSALQALAKTNAVDLWYLVPVHAMSRQVKKDGGVLKDGGTSVDKALGTSRWRETVAAEEEESEGLFGKLEPSIKKVANAEWFEKVAIDQLKSIFQGGVVDEALPLGRNGLHEFSLVFACANPSLKANELAKKLAKAVLK